MYPEVANLSSLAATGTEDQSVFVIKFRLGDSTGRRDTGRSCIRHGRTVFSPHAEFLGQVCKEKIMSDWRVDPKMVDDYIERDEPIADDVDEKTVSILQDLEKIKAAKFCVIDNNCGTFVLEGGEQVELCGSDALIALCQLFNVRLEWE